MTSEYLQRFVGKSDLILDIVDSEGQPGKGMQGVTLERIEQDVAVLRIQRQDPQTGERSVARLHKPCAAIRGVFELGTVLVAL
jgi:hypothetical protein